MILWREGDRLQNRPYVIEQILGSGGFGITYKARHVDLGFPVVLKIPNLLLQQNIDYPKILEQFKKEGQRLARLCLTPHPHIVQITDYFVEGDVPCLVMNFIAGDTLDISRNGFAISGVPLGYLRYFVAGGCFDCLRRNNKLFKYLLILIQIKVVMQILNHNAIFWELSSIQN